MDKKDFAFGRMNFILLAISMVIVVIGFTLMAGDGSTDQAYNPDIFSARRIKVAPLVCLFGFVSMMPWCTKVSKTWIGYRLLSLPL